jgi:AraC family transcriptional regulator
VVIHFYAEIHLLRMGVVRGRPRDVTVSTDPHGSAALVWMLDAPARIAHDREEFELELGTVMLVPGTVELAYSWPATTASHQGYVLFECDPTPTEMVRKALPSTDIVPSLLNHVLWLEAHRPEGWRELATRATEYAYAAFLTGHSGTERHTSYLTSDAVSRVLDRVRDVWGDLTYTPTIPLEDLAEAARVSRQYLCRVFEREVGLGPVECFRLMQLKRAANYLDQTDLPIAEIAARAGYTDESSFSRAFRRAVGATPRDFRRDRALQFDLPTGVRRLVYSSLLT